jgi:uncharacterized protein (DUF1330 family)
LEILLITSLQIGKEGVMKMKQRWLMAGAAVASAGAGWATADVAKPPKGYLVAEVEVTGAEAYKAYAAKAGPVIAACGGTYLARGGKIEALEGTPPAPRFVIVEFASFDHARSCYRSPAYQAIAPIRQRASKSRFWLSEGLPR